MSRYGRSLSRTWTERDLIDSQGHAGSAGTHQVANHAIHGRCVGIQISIEALRVKRADIQVDRPLYPRPPTEARLT